MNNKQLEERFDILNYKYEKTGKVGNSYEPLNPGEYRAIVHLCIFNSKGEMLIQRRNRNKNTWPNRWDITCGGAVISGETVSEAMERELYEELGLKHSFVNERPCISVHYYEGVDENFLIIKDVDLNDITFNDNEVEEVKYASKEEVLKLVDEDKFVFYKRSFLEMFFDFYKDRNHYTD